MLTAAADMATDSGRNVDPSVGHIIKVLAVHWLVGFKRIDDGLQLHQA